MKATLIFILWLLLGLFYWKQSKVCCSDTLPTTEITTADLKAGALNDSADEAQSSLTSQNGDTTYTSEVVETQDDSEDSAGEPDLAAASAQMDLDNKSYVYFEEKKTRKELSDNERELIRKVARRLRYNNDRVCLNGHSGEEGGAGQNYQLGYERAQFIKDWLVRCGVSPHRILTYSKGAKRPLDSNDSNEGSSSNRRVELIFID